MCGLAGDQLIWALVFHLEAAGQARHVHLLVVAEVEGSEHQPERSLRSSLSDALLF